jgi:hypothetical protein
MPRAGDLADQLPGFAPCKTIGRPVFLYKFIENDSV